MLRNYLTIAWKVLLRRRFFTFISLFGISLTLLVLLVAVSLLDHIFAARSPESRLNRTLTVYQSIQYLDSYSRRTGPASYDFLDHTARQLKDAEAVTIFSVQSRVSGYLGTRKVKAYLKRTDASFWQVFDFKFIEGQPFSALDDANARFVAVINESTRDRFFGGGSALGKTIELDDQRFRVIGVVRDVPIVRFAPFADVWVPMGTSKNAGTLKKLPEGFLAVVLAHKAGDLPALRAEFQRLVKAYPLPDSSYKWIEASLETFFEFVSRGFSNQSHPGILRAILVVLAFLFMTLPAMNLMSINLSRVSERSSEIGVRKAFGAPSSSLVAQFVVENLILTIIGGAIGLLLSTLVMAAINRSGAIPYAHLSLNLRIFWYALLLSVVFGLFSGVYPAWRMSRLHPVQALRGGAL